MQQIFLDLTQKNIDLEIKNDCEVYAIFIGCKQDLIDCHINLIHKLPHLTSRILIKAVLFEQAKFKLNCNLLIEKGAKETDAYFKIETLMISKEASAKVIPSLEIMEDDVKGGHGATIGRINQDQLNYLLARGLNQSQAEKIIITGFVNDLLAKIANENIKTLYLKQLENV